MTEMTEIQRLTEVLTTLRVANQKHRRTCLVAMAPVEASSFVRAQECCGGMVRGDHCHRCDEFGTAIGKTADQLEAERERVHSQSTEAA